MMACYNGALQGESLDDTLALRSCPTGRWKSEMTSLGPEYKKLWSASTISNLGDGVTLVAAPLLAASLTRDPLLVAGAVFVRQLAWLMFSLHAGALIDRLDRRLLMGYVDFFRSAVLGFLGIAVLLDFAGIPLLYAVFFLIGAAEPLFDNASVAVLPAVVDRESLQEANGRLFAAQIVMGEFVGPPLGGFLFATAAVLPFLLDAGTFAAAAALVLALRGRFQVERPEGGRPPRSRRRSARAYGGWLDTAYSSPCPSYSGSEASPSWGSSRSWCSTPRRSWALEGSASACS